MLAAAALRGFVPSSWYDAIETWSIRQGKRRVDVDVDECSSGDVSSAKFLGSLCGSCGTPVDTHDALVVCCGSGDANRQPLQRLELLLELELEQLK